jgi:hypothetical protein
MRIECAAIVYKERTYSLPRPARHHDIIRLIHEETDDVNIFGEQGFLLETGQFVRRAAAKRIARLAGQLLTRVSLSSHLFSEDVW